MVSFRNGFQSLKECLLRNTEHQSDHPSCQFKTDKKWLHLQFHDHKQIKKLDELENEIKDPPDPSDENILDRIQGSLLGLALGDALGAHVEFRPYEYLVEHPVKDLQDDDKRSLKKGQFADDTSMALCLAASLVARQGFVPYDQLVRYKWWYQYGYMSSAGKWFNIGSATCHSLGEFIRRQHTFSKKYNISLENLDNLSDYRLLQKFKVYCSERNAAGNGALVRLAPVPLFFYKHVYEAIEFSGYSGQITHGDIKAHDACRYYAALIVAALNNYTKDQLLDKRFYQKHRLWFGEKPLCEEIRMIAEGSYQKRDGYEDGIRGKGYIVNALEAALWAFWSDNNSFEKGVLAAVNLGDDTDTTAAIYGQLAGAYYGYKKLPEKWVKKVYAKKFILQLSKWIEYEGNNWKKTDVILSSKQPSTGIVRSISVENLLSTKLELSGTENLLKNHFDTVPAGKKPVRSSLASSNVDSTSAEPFTLIPLIIGHTIKPFIQQYTAAANISTSVEANLDVLEDMERESSQVLVSSAKAPDLDCCVDWSCKDVCNWIRSLGTVYENYIQAFQKQNIDGHRLLNCVDDDDLIEFGVTSAHNRRVIMYSIKQLKDHHEKPVMSNGIHVSDYHSDYVGDFVPRLYLTDSTYSNTKSCVLKPLEDKIHLFLYDQIKRWIGPLPSEIDIDKIELVHNVETYRTFLQQINRTERQQQQNEFQPRLNIETNPVERVKVLDRLQTLIQQVNHNRKASIVRVWHGCKPTNVSQLVSDGFAALGKLDNGWYGKAMYFTSSAEYATKYTDPTGCLIMCYVVLLNPFPVITDDAPPDAPSKTFRFYSKGNYANYQCHYIPVAPVSETARWNFRPPSRGVEDAPFDELAIFQQSDILPQVIVHLKPKTTSTASESSNKNPLKIFLSKE